MFTSIDVTVFLKKNKDKTLFNFLLFVNDMTSQQLHRKKIKQQGLKSDSCDETSVLEFCNF